MEKKKKQENFNTRRTNLTKQQIMQAAEKEFAEKGLFGARVDSIADRARINKRMIYAHFGSKEGLYQAVLRHVYGKIHDAEEAIIKKEIQECADEIEVIPMIARLVNLYFQLLLKNTDYVRLVMWENLNQGVYGNRTVYSTDDMQHGIDATHGNYAMQGEEFERAVGKGLFIQTIEELLQKGKECGVFRQETDEQQVALTFVTLGFSYFSNMCTLSQMFHVDLHTKQNINQYAMFVVELLERYLK